METKRKIAVIILGILMLFAVGLLVVCGIFLVSGRADWKSALSVGAFAAVLVASIVLLGRAIGDHLK